MGGTEVSGKVHTGWRERHGEEAWERRHELGCRSCGVTADNSCITRNGIPQPNAPHVPRLNDLHQRIEKEKRHAHQ